MFQTSYQFHAPRVVADRSKVAGLLAVVAILLGFTSAAEARVVTVRWTHPATDIAGFRVYSSFSPGPAGSSLTTDLLLAETGQDQAGVFFYNFIVPDQTTLYVTLTAYNDENVESYRSNEKVHAPPDAPVIPDRDNDGVPDASDAFPDNPLEWVDSDNDGTGDNSDFFPNDPSESQDTDGDGYGDNSDVFPTNSGEWADSDGDGHGDNSDAFPNDPTRFAFATTVSPYRVSAGESIDIAGSTGRIWTRDLGFWNTGVSKSVSANTVIEGTTFPELYRSSRTDTNTGAEMVYSFPLTNGTYHVMLYFAEHDHTAAGQRMFDVNAEGVRVLEDFDIFESAGRRQHRAVVRNFDTVVSDGVLEIEFLHEPGRSDPTVMGIEIVNKDALVGEVLTTPGKPFIIDVN